jgi:type IV secretion system protein VirD4
VSAPATPPGSIEARLAARRRGGAALLLLLGAITFGLWIGTQYIAWRFAYHPNLGPPVYVATPPVDRYTLALAVLCLGSALALLPLPGVRRWAAPLLVAATVTATVSAAPLYSPLRFFTWTSAYGKVPGLAAILSEGMYALAVGVCFGFGASAAVLGRARQRASSTTHGTATWGSGAELRHPSGFVLGRKDGHLLRLNREGHLLTLAPTGSGKGVSSVIPNLLVHPGSALVIDPKGENFAVTARKRVELGQEVYALDPFELRGGSARFNPLDLIDTTSQDVSDDARMFAEMLVIPSGGKDDHWDVEASQLLAGLILYVVTSAPREKRHLPYVRELLTLPPKLFAELMEKMAASPAAGGLVARAAAMVMQKADKERSGVISSAQKNTHFLDSPRMETVLGSSTFDLTRLKQRPLTIYLVLPPERLDTYRGWMRLMIACGLLVMTRVPGRPHERVLFLLDEFTNLGKMGPVERDYTLLRGYGVTFWLLTQGLSRLKGTYPGSWESFLENADVLQAFGTNDLNTAEYLSKLTGDATIETTSENRSSGTSGGRGMFVASTQHGSAITTSERGRRLLLPDEVRKMDSDAELLFVKGTDPLLVQRLNYLSDVEFTGTYDENPMHAPVLHSFTTP